MKKLVSILAAAAITTIGYSTPAFAGPAERQIIQQCAAQGVQNEFQMQHCTGGLWVPPHVFNSCMVGGPCFDVVPGGNGGRFQDPSQWQPNPYQQDAISCVATTGELLTGAACAANAVTRRTLSKCVNGVGVRGGCFGPSNTAVQIIKNPSGAARNLESSVRHTRKKLLGF